MASPPRQSSTDRGPIHWMAGHSVTANLLMLVLLIGGLMMSLTIKKEVFPDFELDRVTISVAYPGASPEEVERGVVLGIEEAVQDIDGIKEVSSTANEGVGTVRVEVLEGEDAQQVAQDIKNEVDRISTLPEEAEEPKVTVARRKRYVVSLALFGQQSEWVLREVAETVRDRLLQDPDITQVELTGVRDYEIGIEIPQSKLRAYNLTLSSVAQTLRQAAIEVPGGAIRTESGDVLVRIKERRDYADQFARIPIITANDGTQVLLEEIAVIRDGFEETDRSATFNGQPAVLLEVYRVGDQTPVTVSAAVHRKIDEIKQILPNGLSIEPRNDRSTIYRQRMDLMLRNGFLGLGLVFILLAIFLEARLAFWVMLGIPISFLGSFLILPNMGISVNLISMFAFIVTLGIVVDDAIVVGENIFFHRQSGLSWFQAAVRGAREITMPVCFSVLTNMVAFMPMLFIPGFMGKVFRQIPLVVVSVFTISLIESLLILPAHLGHRRHLQQGGFFYNLARRQQRFSEFFSRMIRSRYGPLLSIVLRYRYLTVSIGAAILLIAVGFVKSGRMGFELFPKVESDYAKVTATLPFGSATQQADEIQQILVKAAQDVVARNGSDQLSEGIFAWLNGNVTTVQIYLTPPEKRPISTAKVTQIWREKVGNLPGLESLKFESDAGGPGRGAALAVELRHRDIKVLEQASAEVASALAFYPEAVDVDDGFSPGKEQIDFKIRPEAQSLGLRARDVARQVRDAYYGAEVLRQLRGRFEVKVMVRLPKAERGTEYSLEEMILRTPTGTEVPLREAVTFDRGRAYTNINRRLGRRIVTVSADARPRSKSGQILNGLKRDILPAIQKKYDGLTYSFEGRQADRRESLQALFRGLGIALIVIFAMLAIPFNSYIQPLIIMLAIPFGMVGAVVGHLIMGYSLSVMSMFGVVALSGVVVNDSLVLVDFANRRKKRDMPAFEAVHDAAIHRFRPIMLTTLTTFGGLAPMIFETSRQARFLIPMAISLGYGILFATVITLALVPAFYVIMDDVKRWASAIYSRRNPVRDEETAPPPAN
ncbi:MAG: efflux RND transporter permease subunit [Desulfobacteraceae bacterium]